MSDGNRSSGRPSSLALSTAEKEYIVYGITGGYRSSRLESRIEEKTKALPDRIDRLVEDIATLAESGRLDGEIGATVWQGLLPDTLERTAQRANAGPTDLEAELSPSTPVSEVGRMLGNSTHQLIHNPDKDDNGEIINQLLFGFVQGLYTDHLEIGTVEQEGIKKAMYPVVSGLQSFAQEVDEKRKPLTRESLAEVLDTDDIGTVAERRDAKFSLQRHVKEVLSENGIDHEQLQPLTLEEWANDIETNNSPSDTGDILEQAIKQYRDPLSIGTQALVGRTVWHLIEDVLETNLFPSTVQGCRDFWTKYDPVSFDPKEFASAEDVLEVFESKRIRGRIRLEERIQEDRKRIEERSWRGVDARDILRIIHQHEPISSAGIDAKLESKKNYKSQVTRLARDLSGENHETRETWEDLAIVTGNKMEWQLTDYGRILSTCWFDHDYWTVDTLPDNTIDSGIDILLEEGLIESRRGI